PAEVQELPVHLLRPVAERVGVERELGVRFLRAGRGFSRRARTARLWHTSPPVTGSGGVAPGGHYPPGATLLSDSLAVVNRVVKRKLGTDERREKSPGKQVSGEVAEWSKAPLC